MDSLSSYREDVEMNAEFSVLGMDAQIMLDGYQVEYGVGGDDYASISEINGVIYMGGEETSLYSSHTGYKDGYFYSSTEEDGQINGVKSPITAEEFCEYMRSDYVSSNIIDFDGTMLLDCSEKKLERTDGGRLIKCSGYSDDSIKLLNKSINILRVYTEHHTRLSDMILTFIINDENLITEMTLEFIYESTEEDYEVPTFEIMYTFSDFDSADPDDIVFDKEYRSVSDVRALITVNNAIAAVSEAESASFVYTLVTSGMSSVYQETDRGTFSDTYDGFVHDIDIVQNGERLSIAYADGKLSVTRGGETGEEDSSNFYERTRLSTILDQGSYKVNYVKSYNVETVDDMTVYTISMCRYDGDIISQIEKNAGMSALESGSTITVKLKDGKLVSYDFEAGCVFTLNGMGTADVEFVINSTLDVTVNKY